MLGLGGLTRLRNAFAVVFTVLSAGAAAAETLPAGFQDSIVISGLTRPTVVRFSPDGRVFVAEKSGIIKVFSSLTATTPTIFADLTTQVDNYWDRGLLGMALDPNFPTNPYVYVLYAFDVRIGGTAPVWNDGCPTPPGPNTDGCVVSGRLSRLTASGNVRRNDVRDRREVGRRDTAGSGSGAPRPRRSIKSLSHAVAAGSARAHILLLPPTKKCRS